MDMAELTALLTPGGLRLLDEVGEVGSTADVARVVSQLRAAGHSPDLVSAVVGQARLRVRARAKFGDFAARMLFTRAGLEQATRLSVAARHAGRFRAAGIERVADLGSGIGGDALGFAGLGLGVVAVDADEVTAAIAAYNLAPFGDAVTVQHGTAEAADLSGVQAVWLDPARRTAGHTETTRVRAGDYSPPLEWAFDLLARMPGGMKLGPAFDRDALPADVEAQWVSADGSTIELVLWSGSLARPGVRRAALVTRGDDAWELTAGGDAEDVPVRPLGAFVHEPDGAVIRARLIGEAARQLQAGMLAPGMAYLTSDEALTSPFVTSFRVREEVPFDTRALARALRERGIGTLEIKKRGVDVDPAVLRTKLKLRGDDAATLILTRVGSRRLALLADRVG
ncbi:MULTISPECIES: class I SAM-dependent methyltransferase [Microbacterium]|uniref:Class I SAM-dependent methyltransferase n=1 Tax=Microbacterium wangchenii TaxID=2541726 RepID=A0ABX5SPT3_9MICO|nr:MULTISPECIES: class I SAM-dependent methyltransferase [Microbacterium]MCK6068039.1 class I SAM-dependent methyltransferase [Microbacterium sp. EYE_512]QBR87827.1 class I SAM-dependent methyltransferase [Microbacterium wangchenii]TXK16121.1 class I SAM-dependent methyltransferase [Microbacterium wangchenii]